MNSTKLVAMFLILFSLYLLYLNWYGKLIPTVEVITGPPLNGDKEKLGTFVVGFMVYIVVMSFLSPENGFALTGVLVLGALLVNNEKTKGHGLIDSLLGN